VYGAGAYTLSRDLDPKQRLTVHVKAKASPATQAALAKLG
jgi:hypothetical protein